MEEQLERVKSANTQNKLSYFDQQKKKEGNKWEETQMLFSGQFI
jgi:hypothetical protein